MSAFLGNIHYWLYNKIQIEEGILEDIFVLGKDKGFDITELNKTACAKFGEPETRALEEAITHDNIHGWLQGRIASVESRLAYVITDLVSQKVLSSDEISAVFEEHGKKVGLVAENKEGTPQEIFNMVYDNLLAGMPCDRVNIVLESDDSRIVWKKAIDIHKQYWDVVDGDVEIFHRAINSWITGFLSNFSGYKYVINGDLYIIERG